MADDGSVSNVQSSRRQTSQTMESKLQKTHVIEPSNHFAININFDEIEAHVHAYNHPSSPSSCDAIVITYTAMV